MYAAGQDRVLTPVVVQTGTAQGLSDVRPAGTFAGTTSVYLEAGDEVRLCLFAQRQFIADSGDVLATRRELYCEFEPTRFAVTHYADDAGVSRTDLEPARFLPPLACADVVKDFLLRTDSFIVTDVGRKVATVLTRAELSQAAGPPLDLTDRVAPRAVEYTPLATGKLTFAPAPGPDDPLAPLDTVEALIGPGDAVQAVASLFGTVGYRPTWLPQGFYAPLPTCSTADVLKQNRSETQWDIQSERPRLVHYTGPDPVNVVPLGTGTVPLAGAVWDGPLAWDGAGGAVGT